MNTPQKSSERAFALQKYLLLHSQHDALQKHLSSISATSPTATTSPNQSPSRSRFSSLSSSPDSSTSSDDPTSFLTSLPSKSEPHFPTTVTPNHRRSGSMPRHSQRPAFRTRRSSLPTVFDESILDSIEEDENKLKDVNLQIKSTLTELLNCESVRCDGKYRMWVQTRLMDAEMELKRERTKSCDRRRSEDLGLSGLTI
ncbi:uncharacterized protein RSE6_00929 [Rhynchosporium secalis]|uniref:Uncharacterized protein n=1 Tax=Rhynchosporium secalis TaxID=38038 RepID=A0A1E1LWG3_RHYSE|nr:uncharacterized protein RSE6_00929 [Rhynchosporium secalis]